MLRFRSLGEGIGRAGSQNCFLLECEQEGKRRGVILDCGQTVGLSRGEDLEERRLSSPQVPDLESTRDIEVVGTLITHIHLDHIGAVEEATKVHPQAPVISSPLALRFMRDHLMSQESGGFRWSTERELTRGPFKIQAFDVLHSTPESLAFGISFDGQTVIYSGDIKTPGKKFPSRLQAKYERYYRALAQMGRLGGDITLILDATNADEEGYAGIEEDVSPHLEKIIVGNPNGRVFLTLISSNIERVENILEIAARYGRRVYVGGSALEWKLYIARKNGWTALNRDSLACMPRDAIVLVTGCQGESNSFLDRLANDTLRFDLRLSEADVLAVAADTIPVPETWEHCRVMFGKLTRFFGKIFLTHNTPHIESLGAEITRVPIHVSGHGKEGDIADTLEAVRPKLVIPFHGDLAHKRAMEKIAGRFDIRTLVLQGHESADLS